MRRSRGAASAKGTDGVNILRATAKVQAGVATIPYPETTKSDIICTMNSITRSSELPSGRFVLRISPGLHDALRREAAKTGLSLNRYCARKLAAPSAGVDGPAADIVAEATEQFGGDLIGVLAFGSWARGDMTRESDVDVLVVIDAGVPIVRSLYRRWDECPLVWDGRAVQVHIVHPPDQDEVPSGLWAEAAMDGVVLLERTFELSRRLIEIRRRVAEGELSRRETHGQPYWVAGS